MPKVFIIILNWNGWSDTLECLKSLNGVDYPNFEIILIDNGSKEKPPVIGDRQFSNLKINQIFNETNLGFSGGNNQGIKIALEKVADYVLLLNNDTIVANDFLDKLVNQIEKDKKIGIIGPQMLFYEAPKLIWFGGGKLNWLKNRGTHKDYKMPIQTKEFVRKVDYITGCCLLVRREVIEKIGLMSEDYFLYYEDADWCLRAKKAGYKIIYVSGSKIWHKVSVGLKEGSPVFTYYHIRNGLVLARRYSGFIKKWLLSIFVGFLYIKQLIKLFLKKNKKQAEAILLGIEDFYLNKMGKYENWH